MVDALKLRMAAMRERAARRAHDAGFAAMVRMVPILGALEGAEDNYSSYDYGYLRNQWNAWAHSPDEWPIIVSAYHKIPATSSTRNALILTEVIRLAGAEGSVTVILRRESLVLVLPVTVLARHLSTLIENGGSEEIGFVAPPSHWIIEVNELGIVVGTIAIQPC